MEQRQGVIVYLKRVTNLQCLEKCRTDAFTSCTVDVPMCFPLYFMMDRHERQRMCETRHDPTHGPRCARHQDVHPPSIGRVLGHHPAHRELGPEKVEDLRGDVLAAGHDRVRPADAHRLLRRGGVVPHEAADVRPRHQNAEVRVIAVDEVASRGHGEGRLRLSRQGLRPFVVWDRDEEGVKSGWVDEGGLRRHWWTVGG